LPGKPVLNRPEEIRTRCLKQPRKQREPFFDTDESVHALVMVEK